MSGKRPFFIRLLSSTRTTAILGVFALASIIYFKFTNRAPKKKKAPKSQVQKSVPLLLKDNILGRAHPMGPILTRSFFRNGDLVLVKRAGKWASGSVFRNGKKILIAEPGQKALPVLMWLKASGGRFALLHVSQKAPAKVNALVASLKGLGAPVKGNANQILLGLYKKAGFSFPTPAKPGKEPVQTQLGFLAERSNFKDIPR